MEVIKILNNRDKERVETNCYDCNKKFEISFSRYRKLHKNPIVRCKNCLIIYNSTIQKERGNQIDEKKIRSERAIKQWEIMDNKIIEDRNKKISTAQIKRYKNLNERKKASENYVNQWTLAKDDIEKEKIRKHLIKIAQDSWNNLSDEEKDLRKKNLKDYWNNLSDEEYIQWNQKRIEGIENSIKNKKYWNNELTFIEDLWALCIKFDHQWYNKIKHKDFDKLFPNNPITGNQFVNHYHCWDFKLNLKQKSILVDIDGSIHNLLLGKFILSNEIDKSLEIKFNDSKRSYQTDGLDAYIIQCYDDKLTNDTKVLCLKDNKEMSYKDFINEIKFLNYSKKEIRKIIKEGL